MQKYAVASVALYGATNLHGCGKTDESSAGFMAQEEPKVQHNQIVDAMKELAQNAQLQKVAQEYKKVAGQYIKDSKVVDTAVQGSLEMIHQGDVSAKEGLHGAAKLLTSQLKDLPLDDAVAGAKSMGKSAEELRQSFQTELHKYEDQLLGMMKAPTADDVQSFLGQLGLSEENSKKYSGVAKGTLKGLEGVIASSKDQMTKGFNAVDKKIDQQYVKCNIDTSKLDADAMKNLGVKTVKDFEDKFQQVVQKTVDASQAKVAEAETAEKKVEKSWFQWGNKVQV